MATNRSMEEADMFVIIVRGKDKRSWMAGSSSQDGVGGQTAKLLRLQLQLCEHDQQWTKGGACIKLGKINRFAFGFIFVKMLLTRRPLCHIGIVP